MARLPGRRSGRYWTGQPCRRDSGGIVGYAVMLPRALTLAGVVWLSISASLLALAVAKGIGLLLLLAFWMIAALAWNAVRCGAGLAGIRVAVRDDDALEAGLPGTVRVLVWMEGNDALPVRVSRRGEPGEQVMVGRGDEETRLPVHPARRGWLELPSAWLSARGPYGLVEAHRDILEGEKVLVLPRQGWVDARELAGWLHQAREGRSPELESGSVVAAASGEEFHGLRNWRAGDSPRLVHWRTTARTGVKMVREHEQPRDEAMVVLLEPGAGEQGEALVALAASVVTAWGRGGSRWLGLVITGARPVALQTHGTGTPVIEMLEALAECAQGHGGYPDLGASWRRGAPVLRLARGPGRIPDALHPGATRWVMPSQIPGLRWYRAGGRSP